MSAAELEPLMVPAEEPEKIRAIFREYGVCLVTNVLSEPELATLEALWRDDLGRLLDESKVMSPEVIEQLKAAREDLNAWPKHWDAHLGMKGMASKHGLPHGNFAWGARMHPKVRRVFAELYETSEQDLVVGMDNVFWSSAQDTGADSNQEWLHVDQNHRTGLTWPCAQGVLYVWPSEGTDTSTTVVWPKSHREVYERIMQDAEAVARGRSIGGQSVKLRELQDASLREELLREAVLGSRRVPCPKGSLLLWDSRTIHQGWRGGPRLAQPICWEPRERRPEAAARRKRWMCCSGVASSHSASEGRVHGMAKEAPRPSVEDGLPLLKASLVPWGVRPDQDLAWLQQQAAIWVHDNPKRQADQSDPWTLQQLLRPEVLEVL